MSTLHLCHWKNRKHFMAHMHLIDPKDGLIIYGSIQNTTVDWLYQQLSTLCFPWYLVNDQDKPHNADNCINHQQWLNITLEYTNSLAWK